MTRPHLSLLGGFKVAAGVTTQQALTRKARAVLAYLALQSGHSQSREKLATLLWGGNGELHARTNLRQALSLIRKAIPSTNGGRLVTDGENVELSLDDIDLDVVQFEELVAQSTPEHLEQAIALYRGDLLDGFSLREEPFEDWLRVERERLRGIAIAALERLVGHYSRTCDFARCTQAASRLLAIEPLREDMHRALMRAYAAQDRFSLALKQYEICRDALQRDLGLQPEPETRRLYEEMRARRMKSDKASAARTEAESRPDESRLPNLQAAVGRKLESSPPIGDAPTLPAKPSVAVVPFESDDGEDNQSYFANGLAENIITGLTRFHELIVIDIRSTLAVAGLSSNATEIGRRLGVANVLLGSVRRSGGQVRVIARLVEAASARQIWAEKYEGNLENVFAVQEEITALIVKTIAGRIEQQTRQRSAKKPVNDLDAYDHLLRARDYSRNRTRDGELAARAHLDQALALDQDLAAAYACYALSYIHEYDSVWCKDRRGVLDEARRLGKKAVALDDNDSSAHRALAWAAFYRDEIELAKREIDRAINLNPYDVPNLCVRSWIAICTGRPDLALSDLNEELSRNPITTENMLVKLGTAEMTAALYEEAIETFSKMSTWDELRLACIAVCHAHLGNKTKAREIAARVAELAAAEFNGISEDPLESWSAYVRAIIRFQKPDDAARFAEGLRIAGLPSGQPAHDSSRLESVQAAVRRQLELAPQVEGGPSLPNKPSVAVLPFQDNSNEGDQAYFANGIAENIITGLTKFRGLCVIGLKSAIKAAEGSVDLREVGRRLGVAHIVEGSIQRSNGRVRVTAQLVDAATGRQLWAEQYDRNLDDIFMVQDDITDLVVATLAGRIEMAAQRRAVRKPVADMAAYDHLLRAREHSRHRTQEGEIAARFHLDRALELDPELPEGYACYALSYVHEYESAWCQDRSGVSNHALRLSQKAVSLDETDAYAHRALAYAAHYCDLSEVAFKEIDRAIHLNPHDYPNLCIRAWIVMSMGRPDAALSDLNVALRLNPIATEMCLLTAGIAEYMATLYQESSDTLARISVWDPIRYACMAACQAQLGRMDLARENAAKVHEAAAAEFGNGDGDTLDKWQVYVRSVLRFHRSDDLGRFAEGLRKAGLPFVA